MSKGPQLTQRKLDKLRDALHVVRECDQVQHTGNGTVRFRVALMLETCDELQRQLNGKPRRIGGYAAGVKKVRDLEPPPTDPGIGARPPE